MKTVELRNKWKEAIGKVDERFLRMVDALHESYINEEDCYDTLPDVAKKLIEKGLDDIEKGKVHSHNEVMSEFRNKYNIASI